MVRPRVFLDFSDQNEPMGRVVFELFTDLAPKTCENFRALATGERGISPVSQVPLSYAGSIIHRSIPGFMIQGGDFTKKNGSGGESIFGGTLLVMANRGPNTNGSQFFISLRPCPHLNGKHVAFGRVPLIFILFAFLGYEVVTKIAEMPTDAKDRPLRPIMVSTSGELELRRKAAPPRAVSPERSRSQKRSVSSDSRSTSSGSSDRRRKKRSRSFSTSESDHRSISRSPFREKRKRSSRRGRDSKKSKKDRKKSPGLGVDKRDASPGPQRAREETEEELDARLEREENERIAEFKKREAARLREKLKAEAARSEANRGVRFKGRGTMKFRDPEMRTY
ncbi:hypothetical protein BS47DRAFT_1371541 [Hydnum rufescens UP504]|uniref:peptidylprolyl isomerase n=1 Tax=Hydnum rufescens UP504 TaxID=1448309 RepID=A0A9P6B3A5_9AGAM|nr:hypothetical protein BS47DRAFT_1371541 [Hydnum rufescens UP504]